MWRVGGQESLLSSPSEEPGQPCVAGWGVGVYEPVLWKENRLL